VAQLLALSVFCGFGQWGLVQKVIVESFFSRDSMLPLCRRFPFLGMSGWGFWLMILELYQIYKILLHINDSLNPVYINDTLNPPWKGGLFGMVEFKGVRFP